MKTTLKEEAEKIGIKEDITLEAIYKRLIIKHYPMDLRNEEGYIQEIIFIDKLSIDYEKPNALPCELVFVSLKVIGGELHRFERKLVKETLKETKLNNKK